MLRFLSIVLVIAMVSGCSSASVPQNQQPLSWSISVRQTLDDGGGICPNPLISGGRTREVCADPPPDPFANWDMQYSVGTGYTGLAFGNYYTRYPVAFNPTLSNCIGQTAHDLAADAIALYTAAKATTSAWAASAGASRFNSLMLDYAAGEIGALAFVWGAIDILGIATVGVILASTALTVYSLVKVIGCMTSGNSQTVGFEAWTRSS